MARGLTTSQPAGSRLGDVFKDLYDPAYNLVSGKLKNPINSEITLNPLGQPVKLSGSDYVFVQDGDEANAIGLVYWDKSVIMPASSVGSGLTPDLYPIYRRGPGLIDKDALPTKDINGDNFTVATLVTAYAALSPPIITQTEPTQTSTQTD